MIRGGLSLKQMLIIEVADIIFLKALKSSKTIGQLLLSQKNIILVNCDFF